MIAVLLTLVMMAEIDRKAEPPKPVEAAAVKPVSGALLEVHRVYVDRLTGGTTAEQLRDLIISALNGAGLFVITESEERADAVLRGAAEDLLYTDKFITNERVGTRTSMGERSRTTSSTTRGGFYGSIGIDDSDSTHIEERKHEAMATVRLVRKDGDVIWSTIQESRGAKFQGASADVAAKIARQLAADFERARKAPRLP
jgi:hypothetical protein